MVTAFHAEDGIGWRENRRATGTTGGCRRWLRSDDVSLRRGFLCFSRRYHERLRAGGAFRGFSGQFGGGLKCLTATGTGKDNLRHVTLQGINRRMQPNRNRSRIVRLGGRGVKRLTEVRRRPATWLHPDCFVATALWAVLNGVRFFPRLNLDGRRPTAYRTSLTFNEVPNDSIDNA